MIYLYLFGTCFHFIYVFMIIGKIITVITGDMRSMVVVYRIRYMTGMLRRQRMKIY